MGRITDLVVCSNCPDYEVGCEKLGEEKLCGMEWEERRKGNDEETFHCIGGCGESHEADDTNKPTRYGN
jgi:hypothetical protein